MLAVQLACLPLDGTQHGKERVLAGRLVQTVQCLGQQLPGLVGQLRLLQGAGEIPRPRGDDRGDRRRVVIGLPGEPARRQTEVEQQDLDGVVALRRIPQPSEHTPGGVEDRRLREEGAPHRRFQCSRTETTSSLTARLVAVNSFTQRRHTEAPAQVGPDHIRPEALRDPGARADRYPHEDGGQDRLGPLLTLADPDGRGGQLRRLRAGAVNGPSHLAGRIRQPLNKSSMAVWISSAVASPRANRHSTVIDSTMAISPTRPRQTTGVPSRSQALVMHGLRPQGHICK